jgi:hypothetical protein
LSKIKNLLSTKRRNFSPQSRSAFDVHHEHSVAEPLSAQVSMSVFQIPERKFEISNPIAQHIRSLVEVRGFEPLTPWLQTMCSAN